MHYLETFQQITTFFFDVDGVLTDQSVLLLPSGEQVRTMNVRDGYALQLAVKLGYNVVIISGGKNEAVRERLQGLGIQHLFLGIHSKLEVFQKFCVDHNISPNQSMYMGDDIPDYEIMSTTGVLAVCPNDAAPEIESVSKYISPIVGGRGCVRDVIEKVLKSQNRWFNQQLTSDFKW